jgi:hypothetical protein
MPKKPVADSHNFDQLEDQLAATLRPVRPEHTFVQSMRERIAAGRPDVAIRPGRDVQSLLVVMTGVVSALVLAAVSARVIFFLRTRAR